MQSGASALQLRAKFLIVLDLLRLRDGKPKLKRLLLHRRQRDFHPAALGTVRLRHHKLHLMAGANQRLQRRNGEHGSTAINKFHTLDCSGSSQSCAVLAATDQNRPLVQTVALPLTLAYQALILRLIMSRLSEERWWM